MTVARNTPPTDSSLLGVSWLVNLRWWALGGHILAVILLWKVAQSTLPFGAIFFLFAIAALSNIILGYLWNKKDLVSPSLVGGVLLFDTAILSLLLYLSGGPSNPLSILYLVHITLAAVVLGSRWTWLMAILASCCYGVLYFVASPASGHDHMAGHHSMSYHLQGMWLAFVVAAFLTSYFLSKICMELKNSRDELQNLREKELKEERLASITNLVGGAIHELATPLASIAVVAGELSSYAKTHSTELSSDAEVLLNEVKRCRVILDGINSHAGQMQGEMPVDLKISELESEIREGLSSFELRNFQFRSDCPLESYLLPKRVLAQALLALIRNGIEASDAKSQVSLDVFSEKNGLRFIVTDFGVGMSKELLAQVGQPFISTKDLGKGMGLGLFLVQLFADRIGGNLSVDSTQGRGTVVNLFVPELQECEIAA